MSRPITWSRRKQWIRKKKKEGKKIRWNFYKSTRRYLSLTLFFIGLLILLTKQFLNAEQQRINSIIFEEENKSIANSDQIKKDIQEQIETNSYLLHKHWHQNSIKKTSIRKHPIIKDIRTAEFTNNQLFLSIEYHSPNIIRQTTPKQASYKEYIYNIGTGTNNTANLSWAINISFPDYQKDQATLSGIFHKTSESTILKTYADIDSIASINTLEYHVWGQKRILTNDRKQKILFDLKNDQERQKESYKKLTEHYENFGEIQEIDLGSIPQPIIKTKAP